MAAKNVIIWPPGDSVIDPVLILRGKSGNNTFAALSYLYYGMDLCVRGAHLKVGYKRAIEIWACKHKVLTMLGLLGFEGGVNE
ncbi:hypothetical protein JCGZ_24377 [Jatropha curcas]|uniref:Uncharacterized protein n=1 Tax=Jatropha curcas TaxID=180498 RepID=A0A067L5V2_JATCU|nr:hypothetical protein JCGZ_24377 [Jatropha curcas]